MKPGMLGENRRGLNPCQGSGHRQLGCRKEFNMAKKMTITEKNAKFEMSLKGGKLPDNFEVFIQVEISFETCSKLDMIKACSGGQSARVMLQSQLRRKSIPELNRLGKEGLKVKLEDILKGTTTSPADLILQMTRSDIVDIMCEKFDLTIDESHELYNKKHGLEAGTRNETKTE